MISPTSSIPEHLSSRASSTKYEIRKSRIQLMIGQKSRLWQFFVFVHQACAGGGSCSSFHFYLVASGSCW